MANLQVITDPEFIKKSWKHPSNYFYAANELICSLGILELERAMESMPLAFVYTNGEYSIVAVQGLQQGINLFVDADGKWKGRYIPATYRGYPFVLADNESDKEEMILCIDADSNLLFDDTTEQPFFDENLEVSQSVKDTSIFLSKVKIDRQNCNRISKSLSEIGLLKPWEIKFELENETRQIDGLFCIDETALNELPGDSYAELQAAGALRVIYCQLLSMQQILYLVRIVQANPEPDLSLHLDELNFNESEDGGTINFENL